MFGACCAKEVACCDKDADLEIMTKGLYTVMVVGARGIRNSDWMPDLDKPDCYCEVRALGEGATQEPLFVTKGLNGELEPMWREEAPLPEYKKNQALQFTVWDRNFGGSDYLGKVELRAGYFNKNGFNGDLPMEEAGTNNRAYLRFKIKPPNNPYPPPMLPKFDVEVERSSKEESWGLTLDLQDDRQVYISNITEGPFKKYNDGQDQDDLKVIATDFITVVNGKTTQLVDELKTSEKATVTVRRGLDLTMIVEKGEASLASDFAPKKVSDGGLVINTLGEKGMFKAYNDQTEDPNMRFQVSDRIVSVNGKTGNSLELHRMIEHAQGTFHVTVIRCAPDGNVQFGCSNTANRWSFYD